jgi:hypothetical protein
MKQLELCYVKFCKSRVVEACVCHHHDNAYYCSFNPFTDQQDESHCVLKFCSIHAEEYKLVQQGDIVKELDIQFKDKTHRHH